VLDVILQRESSSRSGSDSYGSWGHYVAVRDEWGVPDEQEVSVEVQSVIEGDKSSSACRCCVPLVDLLLISRG
jgi:hypothetical protein